MNYDTSHGISAAIMIEFAANSPDRLHVEVHIEDYTYGIFCIILT
jgi:hypothetical protein